jgi:hypothetical protein
MVNIKDKMGIRGKVDYKMWNKDGEIIYEHHTPQNTITELHDALVADRLAGGTDDLFTHCHCGTGAGGGAASTNLVAHIDEARTAVTSSTQGAGAADNDVVVITTFGAGVCTAAIEECGLFSAAAQATADMKCYDDTISKNKGADDTLEITWTITYGAS